MKIELTGFAGDPNDCYMRALPNEPVFTLLARDKQAPALIRKWATDREVSGMPETYWDPHAPKLYDEAGSGRHIQPPHPDTDIIAHARYLAARMEVWRYEHDGEWREDAKD